MAEEICLSEVVSHIVAENSHSQALRYGESLAPLCHKYNTWETPLRRCYQKRHLCLKLQPLTAKCGHKAIIFVSEAEEVKKNAE
ncbi:hypothetical protein SLA2020_120050 [Shorea laevis]